MKQAINWLRIQWRRIEAGAIETKRTLTRQSRQVAAWHHRQRTLGARGERAAARFLRQKRNMYVVEASARNRYGEIDIIAVDRKKTQIIFVEVKSRKSHQRGHPAEAVTVEKQQRISRIALAYLKRNRLLDTCSVRFDVVAITWAAEQRKPTIEHYENAFDAIGSFQLFS